MCDISSFFYRPIEGVPIAVAVLNHHAATKEKLKLDADTGPNSWHEGHYKPNGEIECRGLTGDELSPSECVAEIRAKWPTFIQFFNWAIKEGKTVSGWLDLSGLTSAEREEIRQKYRKPGMAAQVY